MSNMWTTQGNQTAHPQEMGQRLGIESTDATIQKVEMCCDLEVQKIELKNEPKIQALKYEGSLLLEEDREIRDKLRGAPAPGSIHNRRSRAVYYWALTALLSAASFFLLIYTFAPYRMGSLGILYCLGAAAVVPFLFDQVLQNPRRRQLLESLGIVAFVAGLASLMILAWIRGDLLIQELQSATPTVITGDDQPAPEPPNQLDFYQQTAGFLSIALILLAFAMDVGAGLALREARQAQSEDAEDWGKLRTRSAEIQGRLLTLTYEILVLENEGPAFAKAFWADFYKAMLTHTLRSAMGKLLVLGVILLALVTPQQVFAAARTNLVITVDLTKSVAVKDARGQTEFQKNIEAVAQVLASVNEDTRITVIGITDHSFTQPYILLSATVPDDPGYFGERLQRARGDLVRVWKTRTAHVTPSFSHTDIIGALFLASEVLHMNQATGEKLLVIFSDMENSTHELNFEPRSVPALSRQQNARLPIANLERVNVRIAGVEVAGRSIGYWQRLRDFWEEYFKRTGAQVETYTILRQTMHSGNATSCRRQEGDRSKTNRLPSVSTPD